MMTAGVRMAGQLQERVAIVTGAGRGVGRAVSYALAAAGAAIALLARSRGELEETGQIWSATGPT